MQDTSYGEVLSSMVAEEQCQEDCGIQYGTGCLGTKISQNHLTNSTNLQLRGLGKKSVPTRFIGCDDDSSVQIIYIRNTPCALTN